MRSPRPARVPEEHDSDDHAPGERADGRATPAMAKLREIGASMAAEFAEAGLEPSQKSLPPAADAADAAAAREHLRILEALLFAAKEPLDAASLARHLKGQHDLEALLAMLAAEYATRGVNLARVSGKWAFRTAADLSWLLERHAVEERRLSRAALETLSIIAYHQPVTRAEIEEIRGVTTSKGTLDVLLETGWIRPRGRRRAPGKPVTYGTTPAFLEHFGLDAVQDLPGLTELKAAGLLDGNLPPDFYVPAPTDVAALMPDELPLEAYDEPGQAELDLAEPDDAEPEPDDAETGAGDEDGASRA